MDIRKKITVFALVVTLTLFSNSTQSAADGSYPCLDPFSTIDWSYFLDNITAQLTLCSCTVNNATKVGFLAHIVEPIAFVEVVKQAYNFPCIGAKLSNTLKMSGTNYSKQGTKKNTHYIQYPVFGIMNLVFGYLCVEKGTVLKLAPPSELNPQSNDDALNLITHPDLLLYSNPIAMALGFYDCMQVSTTGKPVDWMYWNIGCWGTIGSTTTTVYGKNPITEDALNVAKEISVLHEDIQLYKYSDYYNGDSNASISNDLDYISKAAAELAVVANPGKTECQPLVFPRIIKSQYAEQLAFPVVGTARQLGDFGLKWGNFKQYPGTGEDAVFTVFRRRDCCLGFQVDPANVM